MTYAEENGKRQSWWRARSRRAKIGLLAILALLLVCACVAIFGALDGAPITTTPPTLPHGREVTRAEFGERWPFSVERGVVDCVGVSEAVFRANGVTYAINGRARSLAKSHGYVDLADSDIWRDDPRYPGTGLKVSIHGMINLALQQCQ